MVRVLALHHHVPGSIPGLGIMSAEFVFDSLLAPRGFPLGNPVFPSPQKPTRSGI